MKRLEIFNVVRQIVIIASKVPECILADPNAPAPDGAYASVEPKLNPRQHGQAYVVYSNASESGSVITEVKRQLLVDCSINFYGIDSYDYAEYMHDACRIPTVSDLLYNSKLGWLGTQPVNNLTALQNNAWEQRRQITLNLVYETTTSITDNAIERVPFDIVDGGEHDRLLGSGEIS